MSDYGTLDEVFGKLFDLYMANEIDNLSVIHYLSKLQHPDGEHILRGEDVVKLVEKLQLIKLEG